MGGGAILRDGWRLEFVGWETARVGGMGGGESWRDGMRRELGGWETGAQNRKGVLRHLLRIA